MTFDDGIITIYEVTNSAAAGDMPARALRLKTDFAFKEETVGITRYYEAIRANQFIERVVSTYRDYSVSINDIAVMEDGSQYIIRMVQYRKDENGIDIMVLSLERNGDDYEVIE